MSSKQLRHEIAELRRDCARIMGFDSLAEVEYDEGFSEVARRQALDVCDAALLEGVDIMRA